MDKSPQQSLVLAQSICTHSFPLGVSPKLAGWHTPWIHESPGAQSFLAAQPSPSRPRRRLVSGCVFDAPATVGEAPALDEPALDCETGWGSGSGAAEQAA
jgi:hypothetical protein